MSRITPFLTFEDRAEEAAALYVSIFENSKIVRTTRYGDAGPGPPGSVMTVEFELDGKPYVALNGGPHFTFTEAFSLAVACDTQEEVDDYTEKLTAGGGAQGPCGWVTDRFGVSWQIVPANLGDMLGDPDPVKAKRVMEAALQMHKVDVAALERAYAGAD